MSKKSKPAAINRIKINTQKTRTDGSGAAKSKAFKTALDAVSSMPAEGSTKRTNQNSKQAKLISLLQRPDGASLVEMMKTTGWQAHTIRGVISGVLRKKLGLSVSCDKNKSGPRVYRITEAS